MLFILMHKTKAMQNIMLDLGRLRGSLEALKCVKFFFFFFVCDGVAGPVVSVCDNIDIRQ